MENELDEIAEGKREYTAELESIWCFSVKFLTNESCLSVANKPLSVATMSVSPYSRNSDTWCEACLLRDMAAIVFPVEVFHFVSCPISVPIIRFASPSIFSAVTLLLAGS